MPNNEEEKLDLLIEKLTQIDKKQATMARFRIGAAVVIAGSIAWTALSIKSTFNNFDKELFLDNTAVAIQREFDVKDLFEKAESKLLPALRTSLNAALDKRLPKLKIRSFQFIQENKRVILAAAEEDIADIIIELKEEMQREFPQQDLEQAFANFDSLNESIIENFHKRVNLHYKALEPEVENLRMGLDKLSAKPATRKLTVDEAKIMFIESILDLFKYQVNPKRGTLTVNAEEI